MARVSIEDCLKNIENRFALVTVASHRTRELMSGRPPLIRTRNKEAVTALREIAEGLVLSERTVARHIANIYEKTGAHGRAEVTAYALRHRLA